MHTIYEVSISCGSKVIAKLKVNNRQTNKQTGQKQYFRSGGINKNNMPPIIRSGGIKTFAYTMIKDRLTMVSLSDNSHPTGVDNLKLKGLTFLFPVTAIKRLNT